jgi:hypothetical protein
MNEKKDVTDLGDADYQARIAAAKAGKVPVGGAPMPPIPRFDQAPPDRFQGVQSSKAAQRILTPQEQEELAKQNQFIPGVGSAYAANQPGAQRLPQVAVPQQAIDQANSGQMQQGAPGQFVNPPRPEGAGLRPETVQQLEAVAKANAEKVKDAEKKQLDEDVKNIHEEIASMDDVFETDEFGNRVKSLLNNKQRRDAIEARCEALLIDDLITRGEIRQRVPIVPGKFEPTFRSVGGNEDLFVKRLMSSERGSDQYILDKYSVLNLVSGLYALNGKPLPSHLDASGDPDDKLFQAKFKIVSKMPLAMLADLSVNYTWFGRRLQKLFVVDVIKGF